MKKITGLTLLAAALALSACNESAREDARDVQASQRAVQKDEAAIREYKAEVEADRAEKAAAKARGDRVTQAKKSVEIGAGKAMINTKQTEKKVDERILEEDKEDLRQ